MPTDGCFSPPEMMVCLRNLRKRWWVWVQMGDDRNAHNAFSRCSDFELSTHTLTVDFPDDPDESDE